MRYNLHIISVIAACCLILPACKKYLDVTPKGYTLLTTVSNYDQWLNDEQALLLTPDVLDLLADNVDQPSIPTPSSAVNDLVYTWTPQFSTNITAAPVFWGTHYANINKYNTVLVGIDKATGGTDQQKAGLKAEALLGRSFEYLYLINEYGKVYDPATAAQDPGVPFVTSNDVAQTVPPRNTVKEIYEHIISDINLAIPNLPNDNSKVRFRGSLSAAYSVLARVCLYQGDYVNAEKNAQLALQKGTGKLLDYNALPPVNLANYNFDARVDIIYARQGSSSAISTLDFYNSYDPADLRLNLFSSSGDPTTRGNFNFLPFYVFPFFDVTNSGTSVQEMMLIIAEAAARTGTQQNLQISLQQLNALRIDRFPAATYQPLQSADPATVLNWVLKERTFEFPFNGMRWFDMRRLDKEGRMPAVMRYDAQGNVIANLPPHSSKYTLQIPSQVLRFNPDMQQNP